MIEYICGFKYRLVSGLKIQTPIFPGLLARTDFIALHVSGILSIKGGYSWDGASGPAIDTQSFMRGSLIHDALYELMREQALDWTVYYKEADVYLIDLCKEDGMCSLRRWWVAKGLAIAAGKYARPEALRQVCRIGMD